MQTASPLILVFSALVSSASASFAIQPDKFGQYPAGCHALSYDRATFKARPPVNLLPFINIRKTDIFCIGNSIVIDSPIYTNGGDLVVWASDLTIRAPIDTRVYFDHGSIDYGEAAFTNHAGQRTISQTDIFSFQAMHHPAAGSAYRDAYKDYYVACVDCRRDLGVGVMPQLPSGFTPSRFQPSAVPRDGIPPADSYLSMENVRSGNVYLFFSTVELSSMPKGPKPIEPLACPLAPTDAPKFGIDVSGIRGGRGGAGSPSVCLSGILNTSQSVPLSCPAGTDSGLNGPGGQGGNAGSARYFSVNVRQADAKHRLEEITTAKGGDAGPNLKLRAPTSGGALQPTGSYCDFFRQREGAWEWARATSGTDGEIVYKNVDSAAALFEFSKILRTKAARFDYDFADLAARAIKDVRISSISFDDYVVQRLAEALSDAQTSTARQLEDLLTNRVVSREPLVWSSLRGIRSEPIELSYLTSRERVFLRELSAFSGSLIAPKTQFAGSSLADYFDQSGGALNILSSDAHTRFVAESTRVDLAAQSELLEKIKSELQDVARTLTEIDIREEGAARREQIKSLQDELQKAQSAAQENIGAPWMAKFGDALKSVATAAAAVYAGYAAPTTDYLQMLDSLGRLYSSFDTLDAVWSSYGSAPSIASLVKNMQQIERSYRDFVVRSASRRESYALAGLQNIRLALDSRVLLTKRLESRYAQYHDLLRLALVSYVTDPARDDRVLRNNLDGIRTFLREFPSVEPYFRFRSNPPPCSNAISSSALSGTGIKCVRLAPSRKWRTVVWRMRIDNNKVVEVPLYVVAPSGGTNLYQIHGLPYAILSKDASTK